MDDDRLEAVIEGLAFLSIQVTRIYDVLMLIAAQSDNKTAHFQVERLRQQHEDGETNSPAPTFSEDVFGGIEEGEE